MNADLSRESDWSVSPRDCFAVNQQECSLHDGPAVLRLCEVRDKPIPGLRQTAPMQLNAVQFVQGIGGQASLATMRADNNRHVLDDQQVRPLAVAARHVPDVRSTGAADSVPRFASRGAGTEEL